MIKKLFFLTIIAFLFQTQTQALEVSNVLNIKTGNSYIFPLDVRPTGVKNSNSEIVTVDAVTNIDENDSSLLITTHKEGISYITFKAKNGERTIKLLIDNLSDEDSGLMILDLPKDANKSKR